jgi:4'-phosphopantetheinyl transferase
MAIDVYWLEQPAASVPTEDDWLSESEVAVQGKLRFAKRRADWRLGRWTAKRALSACLNLPVARGAFHEIEVRAAASGVPEAYLSNQPAEVTISLSHSSSRAVCAVVLGRVALGCDLEAIEPRSAAFIADYFDAAEQACIAGTPAGTRSCLVTLLWSAKESALKALGAGLRLDTRSVTVGPLDEIGSALQELCSDVPIRAAKACEDWKRLHVRGTGGTAFQGWWVCSGGQIRTIVAAPSPGVPIMLDERPDHDLGRPLR